MKIIITVMAVAIVAHCSGSAQAQGTPQGSYLQTCTDIRIEGNALSATCRGTDNRKQRSSLAGFQRCVGDIGNNNGVLQCNFADGSPGRGTVVAAPRQQREGDERRSGRQYNEPAYGQPSNSGPYQPPSYGAPHLNTRTRAMGRRLMDSRPTADPINRRAMGRRLMDSRPTAAIANKPALTREKPKAERDAGSSSAVCRGCQRGADVRTGTARIYLC